MGCHGEIEARKIWFVYLMSYIRYMSWIDSAFSSPYTDFALRRNITAGLVATTVACRHHSLIQNSGEFVTMRASPPYSTLFQPAKGK